MSRVSLKKDFKDGEILYGNQVNTNNRAAELGINDNYERILNLETIKADVEDMTEALALKVNTSTFDEAISSLNTTKANVSLVNTKADKTEVALKSDKTYVDNQLATKANITYVDAELTVKADSSDVDAALLLKADKSDTYTKAETDTTIDTRVASGITGKADKTYVDTQLEAKANNSSLGSLSSLNTDNKSSAVAAINEINAKSDSAMKDIDELSITANSSNKMQASGIIDSNSSNVVRTWTGTKEEYDAIGTKNARTLYYITDDEEYVKFTDYATSDTGGVIKIGWYNFSVSDGRPIATPLSYANYQTANQNTFIGKGTLENVITGKDLTTKAYVDGLIGDIATALDTIQGEVI